MNNKSKVVVGHKFFLIALTISSVTLSGCSAVQTMVKKRNLDVQTKMSKTIFLEPSKPSDHVIYVSIKNTSDKELAIKSRIIKKLKEEGFRLTLDPEKAKYMLQADILKCGKSDLRETNNALNSGFGGAVAGAMAAGATGSGGRGIVGAGLIGGLANIVGNALVDDTYYAMITDLQIRERPMVGQKVEQYIQTNAQQGTSSKMHQKISGGKVNWITYRTRILSTANKANLKFIEAKPKLEDGLIRSISGIFGS